MVLAGLETSGKEGVLTITLDRERVQSRFRDLLAIREKLDWSTWGTREAEWWYYDPSKKRLRHWNPDQLAGRDINNEFNDAIGQAIAWARRNTKKPFRLKMPDEPIPLTGIAD
jgi:hypothetical protein